MTGKDDMTRDRTWLHFGGPYGNLHATQALLAEATRREIPPERILCTGDLVAYCGNPVETIDLIRDSGMAVVKGNCDEQLGAGAADCGCGFDPDSACARLSADWYAFADSVVRPDQRRWLAALPARIDLEIGGFRLMAVHGSAGSINSFVFAGADDGEKRRSLNALGCDGVIAGHCGLPFTEVLDGRLWHNPGVIGMPANDGTPRVWFSLVSETPAGLNLERRALSYDHAGAQAAMRRAGLPESYLEALASGIWPSVDVLPNRERQETGRPIGEASTSWPAREHVLTARSACID
jgi:predicted phosphodiesterase